MIRGRARLAGATLALCALLAVTQAATASHPRPKGATPVRIPLVPAYASCTAPNRTHGAPLTFPSCSPPAPTSNYLTVGTPDSNAAGANFVGSVTIRAMAADVGFAVALTDVRCRPSVAQAVCNSPNAGDGPDYSGTLQLSGSTRLSDHYNGTGADEAGTLVDIPFPIVFECANTVSTSVGGECQVATTANAVVPGMIAAGRRTLWQFDQVVVNDGGANGQRPTTLFVIEGLFVP